MNLLAKGSCQVSFMYSFGCSIPRGLNGYIEARNPSNIKSLCRTALAHLILFFSNWTQALSVLSFALQWLIWECLRCQFWPPWWSSQASMQKQGNLWLEEKRIHGKFHRVLRSSMSGLRVTGSKLEMFWVCIIWSLRIILDLFLFFFLTYRLFVIYGR